METLESVSEIPAGTKFALVPAEWHGYREQAEKLRQTAETLTVTSVEQTREMKLARDTRLALKNLRCEVERRRKLLVADAVKTQRDVNAVANEIEHLITPLETRLLEQEQFAERMEEQRQKELATRRTAILATFGVDTSLYNLGAMSLGDFASLRTGLQAAKDAKEAADKIAEEQRKKQEQADADAKAQQKIETDRLRKLADDQAAELKKQQKEAADREQVTADAAKKAQKVLEDQAADARAKQQKAEDELRKQQEAKDAEKKAADLAAKKAARAPDREKLRSLAVTVGGLLIPKLKSEEANEIAKIIAARRDDLSKFIEERAAEL